MKTTQLAWALAALLGSAVSVSCNVNDYCINCATEDGGIPPDGNPPTDGDGGAPTDGDGGQCIVTGIEVCDNVDNDCNGGIDEGALPTIGDPCDNVTGECAGGVRQCVNGAITCTKNPSPEQCNLKDDDCNGMTDENDPGGGAFCGTDQGECVRGTLHCNTTTGQIQCGLNCGTAGAIDCPIGGVTAPFGTAELCNGKDDNCNGDFDEGVTQTALCGSAFCECSGGPGVDPNEGECQIGQLQCDGAGGTVCTQIAGQDPPKGPAFEACDTLDNDCDGVEDELTDLDNDPTNCGTCNNVCDLPNAFEGCASGDCTVLGCEATFHDNNGTATDGCEFGPCTITSSVEVCNGIDDDCNPATGNNPIAPCGNCAENIPAPANFCLTLGACAGATAACQGTQGFQCNYSGDVSTDANGNVVPETECDGIDNDCDGLIDEAQFGTPTDNLPNENAPCSEDGTLGTTLKEGVCRGTGTVECPASGLGPARCVINDPGDASSAEQCDNLDNNCNGQVDEGAATGNLVGQEWVDIPPIGASAATPGTATRQIMKYEASRRDSSGTAQGIQNTFACSKPNVQPWTNITQPDAEDVCEAMGAGLCTEAEWQSMCMPHASYPAAGLAGPTTANPTDFLFIEAEDFFVNTPIGGRPWVQIAPTNLNGMTAMQVANNGFVVASGANALAQSSRLDYKLNLNASTSYFPWIRMRSPTAPSQGGSTAPVAGSLNPSINVANGDLVIVVTLSVVDGGGPPTHNLQSGFTLINSTTQDEGNAPDMRLSVAFRQATSSGTQNFQAFTVTPQGGTNTTTNFTGLTVLSAGTFSTTGIVAAGANSNSNGVDINPPAVTTSAASAVFAVGGWNFGNGAANPPITAPGAFTERWEVGSSQLGEVSLAVATGSGVVDPIAFADADATHSGGIGITFAIPLTNGSGSVYVGLNAGTTAGNANNTAVVLPGIDNQTRWVVGPALTTSAAGTYTFSVYTREDGTIVDTIAIARQGTASPTFDNAWAFSVNPRTDQPTTCNTDAFDTTPGGADQDEILATGSRPVCFADQSGSNDGFDLTGNVKEWTRQRADDVNPLRGGASNNETSGSTCQNNFSVANDDFFFPNVGFRCCRAKP